MTSAIKTRLIETHSDVPIVEVRYENATLLTPEVDLELAERLLELPYPSFAVLLDHNNLSHASNYGPKEEAEVRRSPAYLKLKDRLMSFVRFQAGSFTSMIQTMRASTLLRGRLQSHFAPDFQAALRIARRAIEQSQKEREASADLMRGS